MTRWLYFWAFSFSKFIFSLIVLGRRMGIHHFSHSYCQVLLKNWLRIVVVHVVNVQCICKDVENFAPFTRVFRSTKTTLRQSVESIVFNHLAHLYSLVTAVVQELLSQTWKRTLDFILVYIRYDWLLLGDNQKKVNQFLQLKCSLSHKIQT